MIGNGEEMEWGRKDAVTKQKKMKKAILVDELDMN
jgi:hypothetical protein